MNALETFKLAKGTYKLCNEAYNTMNLPEQIKQDPTVKEPPTLEQITQSRIDLLTGQIAKAEIDLNELKDQKKKAEKALNALR